ncbi:MAG: carbamoyl phosphate synthase large subunit, partial [Mycobacteriaceae bacterium]|nr:carbamoyl phosphate synthase large subunit [Mycobacteriaceae bacterium]MDY5829434.1 carbamoyl phosphate synthase large subunit [Corynebacterium sp.]
AVTQAPDGGQTIWMIEVNPRASRTIPFVSKAIGVPLAGYAARCMVGEKLAEIGFTQEVALPYTCVKEAVFPFVKFPGVDITLTPEMKSTGEVMGLADNFGAAYFKAETAGFAKLPKEGSVFVSVANRDKRTLIFPIHRLSTMGYKILATAGTASILRRNGIECESVLKSSDIRGGAEGKSIVDRILDGEVDLIINTPAGSSGSRHDGYEIRAAAVEVDVPLINTVQGVTAGVQALEAQRQGNFEVRALQELKHAPVNN